MNAVLHTRTRAGFSLVEVLIAVLILAIGLLGLGAVMPVVVREQRLAADATTGVTVANMAKSVLAGPQMGVDNPRSSAWDALLDDPRWSEQYEWATWTSFPLGRELTRTVDPYTAHLREARELLHGFDYSDGRYAFYHRVSRLRNDGGSWTPAGVSVFPPAGRFYTLTIRDRMYPGPAIGGNNPRPQFVWDFSARRVDTRIQTSDVERVHVPAEIQIAVFVRRLDMNIRTPQNVSLYQALTDPSLAITNRRVPVAVDSAGLPTLNGTNNNPANPVNNAYAAPQMLRVSIDDPTGARQHLRLEGNANLRRLASQQGQRLVDNLGTIHLVRELVREDGGGTIVRVEQSIPDSIPGGTSQLLATVRQVVFTPQVPATVHVFNIQRPVIEP